MIFEVGSLKWVCQAAFHLDDKDNNVSSYSFRLLGQTGTCLVESSSLTLTTFSHHFGPLTWTLLLSYLQGLLWLHQASIMSLSQNP